MLNPGLHPLLITKTEHTLIVTHRHFTADVLVISTHLLCHAVYLRALQVNISELGPTCNLLLDPDHPLRIFLSLLVGVFGCPELLVKKTKLAQIVVDQKPARFALIASSTLSFQNQVSRFHW